MTVMATAFLVQWERQGCSIFTVEILSFSTFYALRYPYLARLQITALSGPLYVHFNNLI